MYRTKFFYNNEWELVHEGGQQLVTNGFIIASSKKKPTSLVLIFTWLISTVCWTGKRFMVMMMIPNASLLFRLLCAIGLAKWQHKPDIIHCHDYHTGLIPFMVKYCYEFAALAAIPTVFTIHNARYQGWMGWDKSHYTSYLR